MTNRYGALLQRPTDVQPPEMAVFMGSEPPYDPSRAADEHDALRSTLDKVGVQTAVVSEVLPELEREVLLRLASRAIAAPDDERLAAARSALTLWSDGDLASLIFRQPTLTLEAEAELADISPDAAYEGYVLRPLFGLMFPRDHYVDLDSGVAMGRLRRRDRSRETTVMEAVLEHLRGHGAEIAIPEPHYLEGGDLVACGGVAVLNIGFRTSEEVLDVLRHELEMRFESVAVVRDRSRRPDQFHLDHWFALGPGVAMMATDRLDETIVVDRISDGSGEGAPGRDGESNLRDFLVSRDVRVIELPQEGIANFAANVFFVPGRNVAIGSTACSFHVKPLLEDHGVELIEVPFHEHHKQYGSIHCAVNTFGPGAMTGSADA